MDPSVLPWHWTLCIGCWMLRQWSDGALSRHFWQHSLHASSECELVKLNLFRIQEGTVLFCEYRLLTSFGAIYAPSLHGFLVSGQLISRLFCNGWSKIKTAGSLCWVCMQGPEVICEVELSWSLDWIFFLFFQAHPPLSLSCTVCGTWSEASLYFISLCRLHTVTAQNAVSTVLTLAHMVMCEFKFILTK